MLSQTNFLASLPSLLKDKSCQTVGMSPLFMFHWCFSVSSCDLCSSLHFDIKDQLYRVISHLFTKIVIISPLIFLKKNHVAESIFSFITTFYDRFKFVGLPVGFFNLPFSSFVFSSISSFRYRSRQRSSIRTSIAMEAYASTFWRSNGVLLWQSLRFSHNNSAIALFMSYSSLHCFITPFIISTTCLMWFGGHYKKFSMFCHLVLECCCVPCHDLLAGVSVVYPNAVVLCHLMLVFIILL